MLLKSSYYSHVTLFIFYSYVIFATHDLQSWVSSDPSFSVLSTKQDHTMPLRSWEWEGPLSQSGGQTPAHLPERETLPCQTEDERQGSRRELSWSQCSSSRADSRSLWKEAFPCSCSPQSLSSMPMSRRPTSRCSPSTTPMSSHSSSKVGEIAVKICFLVWLYYIQNTSGYPYLKPNLYACLLPFSAMHSAKQVYRGGCHRSGQTTVLCWHVSNGTESTC